MFSLRECVRKMERLAGCEILQNENHQNAEKCKAREWLVVGLESDGIICLL
jgi:hypothetical protein